jgi:short-subunit dehydrogenase
VSGLKGRVVLLTGASGGIGRATASLLAREGVRLALHGRREEPLRDLVSEIAGLGGEALAVPGDVRSEVDAGRAVAATVARFGAVDALVNNAGIGVLRPFDRLLDSEITGMWETNVLGAARMARAALPRLAERRGILLNVASLAGRIGAPCYSGYAASKYGLIGLGEVLRRELRPRGVRVVTLMPAAVAGKFLDDLDRALALGRGPAGVVLTPEQVARGIADGLRRPRPEIYLPRWHRFFATVDVAFPGLMDRAMRVLYPPRAGSA